MSLIQRIRDKGALISAIIIALALLGFILMDAFSGRTGIGGSQSTTVGKINDHKVNINDFNYKVQLFQQDMGSGESSTQQAVERAWKFEVDSVLLTEQFEQLGLSVTDKEINDILFGANPPQDLKQRFTDSVTGVYNAREAQQFINNIKKSGKEEDKEGLYNYFGNIQNERMVNKYTSLFSSSIYFANWYIEKRNAANSLISKISYVAVPYTTIPDTDVKVTDGEIEEYVKENRKRFELKEENRSISYVLFNARPSQADSLAAYNELLTLKPQFDTISNYETFIGRNSSLPFFNGYISKEAIQNPNKDSILNAPVGVVYGPYLDKGNEGQQSNYVMSKVIDVKNLPDSVKCRHILLGTTNLQTGQTIMSDSVAKFKADSIAAAIAAGANFDSLETKYTSDLTAHQQKGVMTFSSTQIQGENFAKEFGEFILLRGKPGDKEVVKTQFGYHYIEIMEHINVNPHYKVAYLAKPILPSPETETNAQNAANMFAGDSRDLKAFNNNYDKNLKPKGINKLAANDITPMSYAIQGVDGNARSLVKSIFEADKNDVVGPHLVGSDYVVAVVTEVNKEGLMNASGARMLVEPILRNKKKAELISKKIGKISTLEDVAAKTGQQIQTVDSLRFSGATALGFEPKILGASFNQSFKGKIIPEAIAGQQGVYVVRIENISSTPVEAANVDQQRMMLIGQAKQSIEMQMQYGTHPLLEPLKKAASIKDYRADFF